jgi:redox-sensitive bicupin YhaK (pirin superfamily)
VRVVTGSFEGVSSPLVPVEPFTLLDARLLREITLDFPAAHNTVVYVLSGSVVTRADGHSEKASGRHALALQGSGRVTLEAAERAHLLVLSGAQIREPVVTEGPFIMNQPSQVRDAITRYRAGAMGRLAPLAER